MKFDSEIYDSELFELKGFHPHEVESDANGTKFFWTDTVFKILVMRYSGCIYMVFRTSSDKNLVIMVEGKCGVSKREFKIHPSGEYILKVKADLGDIISVITEPNFPPPVNDLRKLGLYTTKIFCSSHELGQQHIELFQKDHISVEDKTVMFNFEKGVDEQNRIAIPFNQQSPNVEILPFAYSKKNHEFNSAVFDFRQNRYIITRNTKVVFNNISHNTLNLYEFGTYRKLELNIIDEVDDEQYEDPRVFTHNDKIYVSCANYIYGNLSNIHQKILVFDNTFTHINNIHTKYGFNGKSVKQNSGVEKNWTYFVHDDRLMCIYKMNPHVVLELNWSGEVVTEYITHFDLKSHWKYGECRGGTNPILKDGYYHAFFHSSLPWDRGRRHYFMGKYVFESKPPFRIVEITSEPILWGNTTDERILPDKNPLVVFPCGVVIQQDKFLVSFGINDEKTGIVTL